MSLSEWKSNLKRLVGGRPEWSADAEFDYYRVDAALCASHREHQAEFAREAHFTGLRIAKGHGLLDTALVAGAHVLDLGAGECCLSEALALSLGAASVWAVDAVPKQIWAAAEKYHDDARLRFMVADARKLPFEVGSFDLVTANLLLHHLEPLAPVLAEVARVLRPGGRFSASEPSPLVGMLVHEKTSANEAPISPKHVRDALATAGFEAVETAYYWNRIDTTALGPLSPGYRVVARKPGEAPRTPPRLTRKLEKCALPGLWTDPTSSFRELADAQVEAIARLTRIATGR